jgi:bifunctional N-acetylglucosamine-1-phosphate-uridyltransferase/glucosamine-1-phosphate-acetyltransferase GlmU-like protein
MKTASIPSGSGQGTRMRSKIAKVLHPVVGRPMIFYAVEAVQRLVNLPACGNCWAMDVIL